MILLIPIIISVVPSWTNPGYGIESVKEINFVIPKSKDEECSIPLPPTATVMDLKKEIAMKCDFQYPVQIRSLGETIVPSRLSWTETIAENPTIQSTWNILADFWNVTSCFRIPLKIQAPSEEDTAVYTSLLQMFGEVGANVHDHEWYQFMQQCNKHNLCSVQDLCDGYYRQFMCGYGQLKSILLDRQRLIGILDVSYVPSTVTRLDASRNHLTMIHGVNRLAGKQLETLVLMKNRLEFNLRPFVRSDLSKDNPLRCIVVSATQVARFLLRGNRMQRYDGKDSIGLGQRISQAADNWINSSILDHVIFGSRNWRSTRKYQM